MRFKSGAVVLLILAALGAAAVAGFGLGWVRRGAQLKHAPAFAADLHAAAPSAPAFQAGGKAPGPTEPAALRAAIAAIAACQGSHVAVAVLDARGALKLVLVSDGTDGVQGFYAWQKALTALYFRQPTSQAVAAATEGSAAAKAFAGERNLLKYPGGLPIFAGQALAGSVGVSGAASDMDERCAGVGVAALG